MYSSSYFMGKTVVIIRDIISTSLWNDYKVIHYVSDPVKGDILSDQTLFCVSINSLPILLLYRDKLIIPNVHINVKDLPRWRIGTLYSHCSLERKGKGNGCMNPGTYTLWWLLIYYNLFLLWYDDVNISLLDALLLIKLMLTEA